MRGQLLVSTTNFDQTSGDFIDIYVNNVINKRLYLTSFNLYSCPLYVGDVVRIELTDVSPLLISYLNLIRRDYTTDDEGGNNGIVDTTIAISVPTISYTFTATTVNSAYDFEYRLENTLVPPTPYPTATPSATPVPTPTFTATPTPSPSPSPTMTGTATPTPTVTGTPTPTPTLPSIACYDLSTIFTGTSFSGLNDVIQTSDYSYVFASAHSGTTYNSTSIGSYVKLNNNTGLTINTGFTLDTSNDWTSVRKIKQLSNGKYIVVGLSTSGYNLRQLNSDGTVDVGFTQNLFSGTTGFKGFIRDFDIQSDGKIIVGGAFTTINGSIYENYARLNTNGTIDTSFYSGGTGTGFSGSTLGFTQIYGVTIQPDNNILMCGDFASYSGNSTIDIIRFTSTGSVDNTFSGSTTFSGFFTSEVISAVLYTSTSKILVRGEFRRTSVLGQNIIMLNNDGTIDSTFDVGQGIRFEMTLADCKPVETSSGSFVVPCSQDNDPSTPLTYKTNLIGGICRIQSNGTIDSTYGGTWNCDDPAPFWPTGRRMNFTKIIIDVNGNYVLTYRYSPTTTYIRYNNPDPSAPNYTNGGYAILDNTGAILKC
jgi:uncharacterized delta-60 repeat protein